jgi:signal peptidase II
VAEAERIIGTPDIPEAAGAEWTTTPGRGARPSGSRRASAGSPCCSRSPRWRTCWTSVSKMIVVAKLEHHEPIEIIGDWLQFEAIRNAGAAFGMGEAFTVIFTVIARP